MSISLEKQLQVLQGCGIRLLPGITAEHLLASSDKMDYENEPYLHLLIVMGGEQEEEPYRPLSANIWHLDTECIEDHGSYAVIARRMRDLADGALPLEEISDYIDLEEGEAWLSFKLKGKCIKWEAVVKDDWIDPKILTSFVQLLTRQTMTVLWPFGRKRFTYLDLKGQDCLLGCSSAGQLKKLRKQTGLDFQWLS